MTLVPEAVTGVGSTQTKSRKRDAAREEKRSLGALHTFSLVLLGLTFLAGVVAMSSLSTVPMKRCSDWVWKDTVPLGSFLMRTAWFLWADSMSWGTDTENRAQTVVLQSRCEATSRRITRLIALEMCNLKKHETERCRKVVVLSSIRKIMTSHSTLYYTMHYIQPETK